LLNAIALQNFMENNEKNMTKIDGQNGIINLKDELEKDHREIIRELLNLEKFNTVKLGYHTLCWDKRVDFAPEYLYEQVIMQKKAA
jgi:hypothetical protein